MTSPFPGESLAATSSGNVTGAAILPGTVTYRADSGMFNAGDESWVDVPLDPLLLEAGDASGVVVSWVVEVLAGSGELVLTEDAGSLGAYPVSQGTLVVASSLTGADVVAGGTARLTISCTSGPVQVQQVKLRAWPVGGALGGFSAPYTPPPVSVNIAARRVTELTYTITEYVTAGNIDEAFQNAEIELAGGLGARTVGEPPYTSPPEAGVAEFYAGANYTAGAIPPALGWGDIDGGATYIEPVGGEPTVPEPAGTFGVDWIFPPNEVPYDPDGWQYTGAPTWGWLQDVATVHVESSDDPDGNFRIAADPLDGIDPPATQFSTIILTANVIAAIPSTPHLGSLEFALPPLNPAAMIRLAIWHDGANPPPFMGPTVFTYGTTNTQEAPRSRGLIDLGRYIDGVFHPLRMSYVRPYRYWTPTPVAVHKLRQYHRDDGKGVAPPRAYGGASRNKTRRAFGYT